MTDISVIVPIYNVETYLRKCLNSIIEQTFTGDVEIICVDDGSTDKSGEILDEYAKKYPDIKAIHQNNQGLSGARNTALKHVTGKYTMFVDSDDFLKKDAMAELYRYAEERRADLIVFDHVLGEEGKGKEVLRHHFENIAEKYNDIPFNIDTADTMVYRHFPPAVWAKFYLTDIIRDLKFEFGMFYEDIPYWAYVYTRAKKIYYYPKPFYFYTIKRSGAISKSSGIKSFDLFKSFSLTENILRESGYFEKFKAIHYGHYAFNLVNKMKELKPELRKESIETIKKLNIITDFNAFGEEELHPVEKNEMIIIDYVKKHDFETSDTVLKSNGIWK